VFRYRDRGEEWAEEFKPTDLGIDQSVRAPQIPEGIPLEENEAALAGVALDREPLAKAAAAAGLAALEGRAGPTRDALIYGAALCLWHLGRADSPKAAAQIARQALDSGKARAHLRGERS
jgi:hypothetical protein